MLHAYGLGPLLRSEASWWYLGSYMMEFSSSVISRETPVKITLGSPFVDEIIGSILQCHTSARIP